MKNNRPTLIIIVLLMSICLAVTAIFFIVNMTEIFNYFKPDITKKYDERYATDGEFVYYHDNGYKKVEGADPATFTSLDNVTVDGKKLYGYQNINAGKDKNSIFIKTTKIEQLELDRTYLLGSSYITDGTNLYFEDVHVENADVNSFEIILGFYAKDQYNLYYKGISLDGADPSSWQLVYNSEDMPVNTDDNSIFSRLKLESMDHRRKDYNYLKDAAQVYYRDKIVEGADPKTFITVHVEGDQWSFHYAKDKNNYYFKGKALPDYAEGWNGKIPLGGLKLLQADKNFGWAEIFYYNQEVFVFDTQELKLVHLFTRPTAVPFVEITRGVYKDDLNVYFSASKEKRVRVGKNGGRRLVGRYTLLQPLEDVEPEDFKKVAEITGQPSRKKAEIFAANGIEYYHPHFVDSGSALAYYVDDGSGLKPEDYSEKALEMHLKNLDVQEPLGLEQIKWQEKYSYYTSYGNFFDRNRNVLFWGFLVFVGVISAVMKRYYKK